MKQKKPKTIKASLPVTITKSYDLGGTDSYFATLKAKGHRLNALKIEAEITGFGYTIEESLVNLEERIAEAYAGFLYK